MTGRYSDIIHLPHKQSETRRRMAPGERAAQFAPFAALVGYGEAIAETIRKTDVKLELSDDVIDDLNLKLAYLTEHLQDEPIVSINYFVPDKKKAGGAYCVSTGYVDEISEYERVIRMSDKTLIPIMDIAEITGDCFEQIDLG